MSASAEPHIPPDAGHERSFVSIAALFAIAATMSFLVVAGLAISWIVVDGFSVMNGTGTVREVDFPAPGVEPNQAFDRLALLRRDRDALDRYGWHERDRRFATIPIERAMELIDERHLAGLSADAESPSVSQSERPQPVEASR